MKGFGGITDMDTEETESGVTLGEICRIILRKIWIILGVSVAGAVIEIGRASCRERVFITV